MTGATPTIASSVELLALVTPANSTSQFFAGTTYYGTNWESQYGDQQVVPFLAGPQGIAAKIKENDDRIDNTPGSTEWILVLSSGWGAGQTGTALGSLTPEDVAWIGEEIREAARSLGGAGDHVTLYDLSGLQVAPAAAVDMIKETFSNPVVRNLWSRKLAVVASTALIRMQAQRVREVRPEMKICESREAALEWLLA